MLSDCALLSELTQKDSGTKETKILADLSKMASVLNMINGTQGYTSAGGTENNSKFASKDSGKLQ